MMWIFDEISQQMIKNTKTKKKKKRKKRTPIATGLITARSHLLLKGR